VLEIAAILSASGHVCPSSEQVPTTNSTEA